MFNHIPPTPVVLDAFIDAAMREDIANGDHTTNAIFDETTMGEAVCKVKDTGVLAGVAFAEHLFNKVYAESSIEIDITDGAAVKPSDEPFCVQAPMRTLLTHERLMLNVMQRMSGVATATRRVVDQLEGMHCRVLDTRKTTPLFRHLEKWAVQIGGGTNHRFGLFDMVMIKDNHIDFAGGVTAAIERVNQYLTVKGLDLNIEVETRNLEEVQLALETGIVDRIMLDNMSPEQLADAVRLIDGRCETEASGGITLDTARQFAESGVDFISMGALTHQIQSLDISFKAVVK